MGAVAGLFIPDDAPWPRIDPTDPSYRADLENTLAHFGAGRARVVHRHHH
jgi:hypothetical protein